MCDGVKDLGYGVREMSTGGRKKSRVFVLNDLECKFAVELVLKASAEVVVWAY